MLNSMRDQIVNGVIKPGGGGGDTGPTLDITGGRERKLQ